VPPELKSYECVGSVIIRVYMSVIIRVF
jgi:hypothetical protein